MQTDNTPIFDHDWFKQNVQNLEMLAQGHEEQPLQILEIGAFEGRSTLWFAEKFPNAVITTIDTWKGGHDHTNMSSVDFEKVKANFRHNLAPHRHRVRVMEMSSFDALITLYKEQKRFSFVYVDGSHTAIDVNLDLTMSFKLLDVSGLIYCDDYFWGFNQFSSKDQDHPDFVFDTPKIGIDAFIDVYRNKIYPVHGLQNTAAVYTKVRE